MPVVSGVDCFPRYTVLSPETRPLFSCLTPRGAPPGLIYIQASDAVTKVTVICQYPYPYMFEENPIISNTF